MPPKTAARKTVVVSNKDLSKQLDSLIDEFRHVVYGNGEIGMLEAARALKAGFELHEKLPIHAVETFEMLKSMKKSLDDQETKRIADATAKKSKKAGLIRFLTGAAQAGLPSALAAAGTLWALLHH
jgi:hypothetical protein